MVNSEIMSESANREIEAAESRHRRDSEDEQLLVPMEMELPDRPYVDFPNSQRAWTHLEQAYWLACSVDR